MVKQPRVNNTLHNPPHASTPNGKTVLHVRGARSRSEVHDMPLEHSGKVELYRVVVTHPGLMESQT